MGVKVIQSNCRLNLLLVLAAGSITTNLKSWVEVCSNSTSSYKVAVYTLATFLGTVVYGVTYRRCRLSSDA
jgi:hypothetical protein